MRGGGKMGISGKDWIRLQQRRRGGDEEYVCHMKNCASLLENVAGEETWRLAQLSV